MTQRRRLLLALLWLPLAAAADCPPELPAPTPQRLQAALSQASNRGLLWKATREGRSLYLYGTLHVGNLDWAIPGPAIAAALRASDTLALELDITDPQLMARMTAPASPDAPPPPALPAEVAERLARRIDAACVPAPARPQFSAMHPVMRAVALTVLESRWVGLDPSYAQEAALAGFARSTAMRIVSLETPEQQLAALVPADPDQVVTLVSETLAQIESGAARRAVQRLSAAWERGDLAELSTYDRWCDCAISEDDRRLMKRLLDDRNTGLADGIEAQHRAGRQVFAGVGVLHMIGPTGLPTLLAARGFQVERVPLPPRR